MVSTGPGRGSAVEVSGVVVVVWSVGRLLGVCGEP